MTKPVILCLNDEDTALMIRKLVLEQRGYNVIAAMDAQSAIEIIRRKPVDLVIADHLLSDALGTDVAAEMKQIRADLPIILLSGVVEEPENIKNVDAFVSKTDGPDALFGAIRHLLHTEAA